MQAFSFKITCLLSDAMEIINIRNFWFDFERKEFPLIVDETGAQKHAISRFSLMWQSYFNVHTFVTTKQHEKVAEKTWISQERVLLTINLIITTINTIVF